MGEKRIGIQPADLTQLVARRPPRRDHGERSRPAAGPVTRRLSKAEQRRGLAALAALERLSAAIAARRGAKLTPESWELINQSRDERTDELMRAVKG